MRSFDYTILKDFCKVRNHGDARSNTTEPTPRMVFIMSLLESLGIKYYIDSFSRFSRPIQSYFGFDEYEMSIVNNNTIDSLKHLIDEKFAEMKALEEEFSFQRSKGLLNESSFFNGDIMSVNRELHLYKEALRYKEAQNHLLFNIVIPGTSSTMFIAHHDVKNHMIDNCNDNSASIINLIALKMLKPEVNIVFTDAEELENNIGCGADHLAHKIKENCYGDIHWVVNLELTAVGGTNFVVGRKRHSLFQYIKETFKCESFDDSNARSDTSILTERGIQSCVLTTLPLVNGKTDFDIIKNCHTNKDTIYVANYEDMQNFVEQVLVKLVI